MRDLHSHLLFGIDDGCKNIEESVKIIKKASEQGISDLMITPHYIENSKYACKNKEKYERLNQLKEELKRENININLYLGNEIYITRNILELLKNEEIHTLHDSRYLLIEFPFSNMLADTKEILYELVRAGYVPIIAHPERYRIFQKHPQHIEEYLRMGVLLQGNYMSLYGKYGKDAKKLLKYYLKNHWISFLGSDCHHETNFKIKSLQRKLKHFLKNDKVIKDLLENNFLKVINNEEIGIRR